MLHRTCTAAYEESCLTDVVPAAALCHVLVCCLQDGSRLEITGLEKYQDIKRHIASCIYD